MSLFSRIAQWFRPRRKPEPGSEELARRMAAIRTVAAAPAAPQPPTADMSSWNCCAKAFWTEAITP